MSMRLLIFAGMLGAWGGVFGKPIQNEPLRAQLALAGDNAPELRGFLEAAAEGFGKFGEQAAVGLVEGMPERDLKDMKKDFLVDNLTLAMQARDEFPWAGAVPDEVFINDVIPYASLDETREAWRPEFLEMARAIVKDCKTATEAGQALNREFFDVIKVHYNTGRNRPNQSPSESRKLGKATCTGLSIILVDACRAVGVPARVAGTPLWTNKRGNHTWVEIYDRGEWYFTGADEYNKGGLNKTWFNGDASRADAEDWKHAIWATSWKPTGSRFPMVWDLDSSEVHGVNVTERYTMGATAKPEPGVPVHLRVFDKRGGQRIEARIELLDDQGGVAKAVTSKAGNADMNDMATITVAPSKEFRLRLSHEGNTKSVSMTVDGEDTRDLDWSVLETAPAPDRLAEVKAWLALLPEERHLSIPKGHLTKDEAFQVEYLVFQKLREELRRERADELKRSDANKDGSIKLGVVKAAGMEMRVLERSFGRAPKDGPSLWISLHGGGGAPARVNEQQWKNQIQLYEPEEGVYVAPRAPTDNWNLWHEGHMDDLIDRLIENYVITHGVNTDRVYILGYSAGGDGVYQLGPRMADRFAAASMMAGHPNDASPLGLRNLPFMIWMGANDSAYKRNTVAAEWGRMLDDLQAGDAGGYVHETHLVKDCGHWMNRADAAALPWMAEHSRRAWPKKLVWRQSGRTHERFYWLEVPKGSAKGGQILKAAIVGQKISLRSDDVKQVSLRLSDGLVDLDREIEVLLNGKKVFQGLVKRDVEPIFRSLSQRLDLRTVASATLEIGE